jgi:hypothetical protein
VYAWAKAATKPSYAYSEISSTPTNLSSFSNDSAFLTAASFLKSSAGNGYIKLPSNIMIAWGSASGSTGLGQAITPSFAAAFVGVPHVVVYTLSAPSSGTAYYTDRMSAKTASSFSVTVQSNAGTNTFTINYIAIGAY